MATGTAALSRKMGASSDTVYPAVATPIARLARHSQETEVRSLADKLAAARENNRFADRRIADLEARIAEPQLGQGNEVGQHSANGKP